MNVATAENSEGPASDKVKRAKGGKSLPSPARTKQFKKSVHSMLSSQVRVGVRVRPVSIKEHGSDNVVHVDGHSVALLGRRFTYDHVFDPNTTQSALYEQVSPQLLQSFLEGYNATVREKIVLVEFFGWCCSRNWTMSLFPFLNTNAAAFLHELLDSR